MHYNRVSIDNFRGLRGLLLEDLRRINLLVGPNNSGKTSVLEALWLLQAPGNPALATNLAVFRGLNPGPQIADASWLTLFGSLDRTQPIEIGAGLSNNISERLQVALSNRWPEDAESGGETTTTLVPFSDINVSSSSLPESLEYEYFIDDRKVGGASLSVGLGRVALKVSPDLPVRLAIFLASRQRGGAEELAARFTKTLDTTGVDDLVRSLAVLEPRIKDLSLGYRQPGAQPPVQLRAHLDGVPVPIPIQLLGEGVGRLIEILLAFGDVPGGLLLVDEVENGLYYRNLETSWRAICQAASINNTQLIATTHSAECVASAVRALANERDDEFRLFRLERTVEGTRVTAYDHETAEAALDFELEFR